ncbi:MAG: hypothetical protein ABI867_34665 [Kofleriaceae bacterium]
MTKYEFFRRRIAPVAFLGMVGLIAYDACKKQERTHATVQFDLGERAADVTEIDVQLSVAGDVIGTFHRRALPGSPIGPCTFETALTENVGQLRIEVDYKGKRAVLERTIRPIEGSTVTVPLAADLP